MYFPFRDLMHIWLPHHTIHFVAFPCNHIVCYLAICVKDGRDRLIFIMEIPNTRKDDLLKDGALVVTWTNAEFTNEAL